MKRKTWYLTLLSFSLILFYSRGPLTGQPQPGTSESASQPSDRLAGIEQLYVELTRLAPPPGQPGLDPAKDGLSWDKLQRDIENKLKQPGLKLVPRLDGGVPPDVTKLIVNMRMFKFEDSQQYVFSIQILVGRNVYLTRQSPSPINAIVSIYGPTMRATSVQDMPNAVADLVMEQVEAFILAHRDANPPGQQSSDTDASPTTPATTENQSLKQFAQQTPAEYKYIASKNSKVFHKPECGWVKRIAPKNLVGYASRQEAINAGKRPCKWCKP